MVRQIIQSYRIHRFQHLRHRLVGDSQLASDQGHAVALELVDQEGRVGLGFAHAVLAPYGSEAALKAGFEADVWPGLEGKCPAALIHRITRPRGGNRRDTCHGLDEALQIALWDLASQGMGLSLAEYLGATRDRIPTYASGLDFHMSDEEFVAFFTRAADAGFNTFKIKIGSNDFDWDMNRFELLQKTVGKDAGIMADANEAWTAKEAMQKLTTIRNAGIDLIWMEDPILRDDIAGLKALCSSVTWTQINSGEYLDVSGRRALLQAGATDILNVHGRVTDVMRVGWMAADMGIPVSVGNTFLETGVHAACALPEVEWLEYSFLDNDHLVDQPIQFEDGFALVPDRPGVGMALSDEALKNWHEPEVVAKADLKTAPPCRFLQ